MNQHEGSSLQNGLEQEACPTKKVLIVPPNEKLTPGEAREMEIRANLAFSYERQLQPLLACISEYQELVMGLESQYGKEFRQLSIEGVKALLIGKCQYILSLGVNDPTENWTDHELGELLNKLHIPDGIKWMIDVLNQFGKDPNQVMREATQIIEQEDGYVTAAYYLPRREIFTLLKRQRLLGLESFQVLDDLANLKIGVIGSSASQDFLALLVTLGAGTGDGEIRIADPGMVSPTTLTKTISGAGMTKNLGLNKAENVRKNALRTNPYSNLTIFNGSVTCLGAGQNFGEFATDLDGVIEVGDDPRTKILVRLILWDWWEKEGTEKFVGGLADAKVPYIEILSTGLKKMFGQDFSREQIEELRKLVSSDIPREAMFALQAIIANAFIAKSPETFAGTVLSPTGSFPQSPISSTEAASRMVDALLNYLQFGRSHSGFSSQPVRMSQLTDRETAFLEQLFELMSGGMAAVKFS